MLTKNQFYEIFDIAITDYLFVDQLCEVLESSESKLFNASYRLFDFLVDEMEDNSVMDKKLNGQSLIMLYIFQYGCGTAYENGDYLCEINGKKYAPTTAEELYNCLVEFYENEE